MKFAIFYLSMTGNTKYASEMIKKGIEESGNSCDLLDINGLEFYDFDKYDIFGFGCPVFAFREPKPVRKFIKGLKEFNHFNCNCFIFCTCEGNNGNALYRMAKNLRRKGCQIFAKETFYYPSSYIVWNKKDKEFNMDPKEINKAIEFGKTLNTTFKEFKDDGTKLKFSWSPFSAILGFFSSDTSLRFYLGKIKVDEDKCTKCSKCAEICPINAIELNPYPEFSKDCIGCCGCINMCPEGALDSKKTKNKPKYKFDTSFIGK
ncbi:MAG: hypothetical protein EU551_03575 [Promethearchaeota archaeon]|nr:MAG: hypothetical protein EU551_03575 [Candidatus Lokiarchaeota archaeon]